MLLSGGAISIFLHDGFVWFFRWCEIALSLVMVASGMRKTAGDAGSHICWVLSNPARAAALATLVGEHQTRYRPSITANSPPPPVFAHPGTHGSRSTGPLNGVADHQVGRHTESARQPAFVMVVQ